MLTIDPKDTATHSIHGFMLGAVGPRPIAFASTVDENGNANLAPFSFYNAFSSDPPTLVFSANRRVGDNTTKDTLANIEATREVVINAVSYKIVRQMALTSIDYPKGVDEFEKGGFTKLASERVKPWRVAESPVHFECKVKDIIKLSDRGGAGNLFICEIVLMHVDEAVLDKDGHIDPHKIDLCARIGGPRYVRASGDAVFEIIQPYNKIAIGMDNLPQAIRHSAVLTGNELAALAGVEKLPDANAIALKKQEGPIADLLQQYSTDDFELERILHIRAQRLIQGGWVEEAWKLLLVNKAQPNI